LQDKFPTQAGFVSLPPVSKAILEKLSSVNVTEQDKSNLLAVVRDESRSLRPLLDMSPLSLQISQWSADEESELSKELLLVMSLREAKKKCCREPSVNWLLMSFLQEEKKSSSS
jgi:hypothetical protein